jgi:hypothetical protein
VNCLSNVIPFYNNVGIVYRFEVVDNVLVPSAYLYVTSQAYFNEHRQLKMEQRELQTKTGAKSGTTYIYNTCALSKHIDNMCMRLRNGGKGESYIREYIEQIYVDKFASINEKKLYVTV